MQTMSYFHYGSVMIMKFKGGHFWGFNVKTNTTRTHRFKYVRDMEGFILYKDPEDAQRSKALYYINPDCGVIYQTYSML